MEEKIDYKKRAYIVIAAVSAVLLICVVLVGMIDGFWPWEPGNGIINQWIDPDFGKNDETTSSTEDTTADSTESTEQEENEGGGNKKPSKPSNNNNNVEEEEPTIGIEVGDNDNTTPSGGEDPTEGTSGEGQNGPEIIEDEEGNKGLTYQDLLDKLYGNNGNG